MNILEISKSSSAKTEFSFFFGIFSVGFFNTDVGVGFGFLKYRDIGFGYRLGSTARLAAWFLSRQLELISSRSL